MMILFLISLSPSYFHPQDWDRTSTPLRPNGTEAKFVAKPQDKFSGNEKENIFIHLEVFGDPPPKVEWFKVRRVDHSLLIVIVTLLPSSPRASKTSRWKAVASRAGQMAPPTPPSWGWRRSSRKTRGSTSASSHKARPSPSTSSTSTSQVRRRKQYSRLREGEGRVIRAK